MFMLIMSAIAILALVMLQEVRFADVDDKVISALNKELKRQGALPTPRSTFQHLWSRQQYTPVALQAPPPAQAVPTIQACDHSNIHHYLTCLPASVPEQHHHHPRTVCCWLLGATKTWHWQQHWHWQCHWSQHCSVGPRQIRWFQ